MNDSEARKVLKYIKKGSVSKLRRFLRKHAVNLNEIRDSKNSGVLHLACFLGESRMTRFLLRSGVDPCTTDDDGNTPMHVALKYALEFNNESVFLELILPLKKKSKRIMHLRNKFGETPEELFGALQRALREELLEREKMTENEEKGSECGRNAERQSQAEQQEWFEKLAYEESCEDFYFKDTQETLSGEQFENYDEWAERIRREFSTKYRKVTAPCSGTQQDEEQHKSTMNANLTKKLAKQHEEYMNKVKLKRNQREKEKYEQNCQNVFESGDNDELTFEQIPWPCSGCAADIVEKLSEWAGESKVGYLKVQRVRWHPDRFAQRCQHRIKDNEREKIMDLVNQISQGINVMISSL